MERNVQILSCQCKISDYKYIAIPITVDFLIGLDFVSVGEYLVHQKFVNKFKPGGGANQIVLFRVKDIDDNGNVTSSYSKPHIKYIHQVIRQLNADFAILPK